MKMRHQSSVEITTELRTVAQMSFAEFVAAAEGSTPAPTSISPALLALWHERRGGWDAAHEAVQGDSGKDAAWVHAYLHRKEGDQANAAYWYARARRPVPATGTTASTEWGEIAQALFESERG